MQEKGQNVEGGEQIGEVARPVPKIMLEVVAPELEGLDVLIFDFPSCPSGEGQGDERVGGDRMVCDPRVVIETLSRLDIGNREFKPVHRHGIIGIPKGNAFKKAEGPTFPDDLGDPLALGLSLASLNHRLKGSQGPGAVEVVDPLGNGGVRGELAGEEEVEPGLRCLLAKGLMGIEVVSEKRDASRSITGSPEVDPSGGGPDLAVLLAGTIGLDNELGGKRNDPGDSWSDQGRGDGDMAMLDASVGMAGDMTRRAMNPALRGKGVGSIESQKKGAIQHPIVGKTVLLPQDLSHAPDERRHMAGRNGVEDVPDLNIRRNMMDPEQGVDVASTGVSLQGPLKGQKGRRLGEEDRKGGTGGIGHGILSVVPGFSFIGKRLKGHGDLVDQSLSGCLGHLGGGVRDSQGFHAPRLPQKNPHVQRSRRDGPTLHREIGF